MKNVFCILITAFSEDGLWCRTPSYWLSQKFYTMCDKVRNRTDRYNYISHNPVKIWHLKIIFNYEWNFAKFVFFFAFMYLHRLHGKGVHMAHLMINQVRQRWWWMRLYSGIESHLFFLITSFRRDNRFSCIPTLHRAEIENQWFTSHQTDFWAYYLFPSLRNISIKI